MKQGKFDEAKELTLKALKIRRSVFGSKHVDTARSIVNLASIYHALGNYQQSSTLYNDAKEIMKEAVGEKHANLLPCLTGIANCHYKFGEQRTKVS